MPPKFLASIDDLDIRKPLVSREAIRDFNPQRFEFEMLTSILKVDLDNQLFIGHSHQSEDAYWTRGHIPGRPLMPGVLMLEAAAQVSSYAYKRIFPENSDRFLGFYGLDKVRFRESVYPGDDLILILVGERVRPRMSVFKAQGVVGDQIAFEAKVMGALLPAE